MAQDKDLQELTTQVRAMLQGKDTMLEALNLSLEEILALAQVGRQLADQGKLDEAETVFEALVSLDPSNPYLLTSLGCVYMQRDRDEDAADAFSAALWLNENDITAQTFSGEIALEKGDVQAALKHFQKAVELDPHGKDPFANRARVQALLVQAIAKEVQAKGPDVLKQIQEEAKRVQSGETVSH